MQSDPPTDLQLSARFFRQAEKTARRCARTAKREGDEASRQKHLEWMRDCRTAWQEIEKKKAPTKEGTNR
jgi:hypothetical protein